MNAPAAEPDLPFEPEWIDSDAALADLVDRLAREPRYALDTEFHGERSYFPRLALLQVAWSGGLALVDPLAVDVAPLGEVLAGPGTMVAHAADQDLTILERACGRVPTRCFDTQVAAGFLGMGTPALTRLAEDILKVRVPKGDRLTDWTRRPLAAGQKRYAAGDVAYLLDIQEELERRLGELGRQEWCDAECADRLGRDRSPQDPETAWWRLKGSRSLRGPARGVAQEVTAWRERQARAADVPPRFILSDLALAGVIQRAPRNIEEVASIRGVDAGVARGRIAKEIVAAVERGLDLGPDGLRLPPRAPQSDASQGPAIALIAAWLGQRAGELRIETSLLGTRADLSDLVSRSAGRLTEGWRAEIVGEPVRGLLAGETVVALDAGGTRLVLEPRTQQPGGGR
jgi:ribonuclease D